MSPRSPFVLSLLAWPIGLLLVLANMEIDAVTLPVFVGLDLAYVGGVLVLLRFWRARRDPHAAALVLTGTGIFATVGYSGPPTADEPGLLMLNTAALLVVAVALLLVATQIVVRHRASPRVGAVVPVLVLFAIGSTLYLGNLVARLAVVLSGAAGQQAAVEDRAWAAYEYLRGLEGSPGYLAYLLVWLDLLQLAYCVTAYVCFAGIAVLLHREGVVSDRAGSGIAHAATAAAGVVVLGVAASAALPREADLVPAWATFVFSIPFMSTLVPFVLGLAMLQGGAFRSNPATPRHQPPLVP